MCSHNWSSDYYSLLSSHNISPLSTRHFISKLCLVHKISNKLIYFPSDCFIPKPLHTHCSCHYDGLMYSVPFASTSASENSFVLSTLSLWNPLPYHVKSSTSLTEFKHNVKKLFTKFFKYIYLQSLSLSLSLSLTLSLSLYIYIYIFNYLLIYL